MGKAFAPPMCLDASRLTCSDEASSYSNSLADARIVPLAMVSRAARSTNTPPVFCRDARPWLHGRRWCVFNISLSRLVPLSPRNTDATRRFVFRSRICSPSFSQIVLSFAFDLRRGVRRDARESESPTPSPLIVAGAEPWQWVSLIVAGLLTGKRTVRGAYSRDGTRLVRTTINP